MHLAIYPTDPNFQSDKIINQAIRYTLLQSATLLDTGWLIQSLNYKTPISCPINENHWQNYLMIHQYVVNVKSHSLTQDEK